MTMTRPWPFDPYLGCNFAVEIKGLLAASFSEVSGLAAEVEVEDYREGGVNDYLHRLSGPVRYPSNLLLKRGLVSSSELWKWLEQARQGQPVRHNGSIILFDGGGGEAARWSFCEAHPVRWSGPDLKAGTAEVAIETLELVHRGLVLLP